MFYVIDFEIYQTRVIAEDPQRPANIERVSLVRV